MRRATIAEYDRLSDKLTSLVAMMDYKFKNICIKAEEVALLPITVHIEGEDKNLEECATIAKEDDYHFMIFPKYDEDMQDIAVGIAKVHPEFRMERKSMPVTVPDSEGNEKDVDAKYILLTMPVVDDNRYDVMKQGVDVIYNLCKEQMESANMMAQAKFASLTPGETKEDLETLKKELDKLNDEWNGKRDDIHNAKLKEIEDAHNKWLEEKAESSQAQQEEEAARGDNVTSSMKFE
jgi:uncharacterized protein YukE